MRWYESYINKQRHEDKILNEIEKTYRMDAICDIQKLNIQKYNIYLSI